MFSRLHFDSEHFFHEFLERRSLGAARFAKELKARSVANHLLWVPQVENLKKEKQEYKHHASASGCCNMLRMNVTLE
jgi:hypothetical protein